MLHALYFLKVYGLETIPAARQLELAANCSHIFSTP
jgi:hypothetical protein